MSQNWDLTRVQTEFRKHEIIRSADKLVHVYPLNEKTKRKNSYHKNRRANEYESVNESDDSHVESEGEETIIERRNYERSGYNRKEQTEEFLFPENVYKWLNDKHIDKLKTFRNNLKLKQVSIARQMKNEFIQDFKKENPTKDVGKLPVIKRYNRYQQVNQLAYYDSDEDSDGELSADSSYKSSAYRTNRMFRRIDTSDDEDSNTDNFILQRSNNTEYDSDESSIIEKSQTRYKWDSSSSEESNDDMNDSDTDKNEETSHKDNIKKRFKNFKLTETSNITTLPKNNIEQNSQSHIKIRSMKLRDKFKTYIVIDSGAQQQTTGKGMRIMSKSLFPSIKMGGPSKLLGYINMHTSTGLAKVKTTQ
jgi:hypothetical protein